MPDVIDSFVIELGLDPAKFNEGQKTALDNFKKTQDQAVKFGKEIESQGGKITDFFSKLRNQAIGLFGAYLGGSALKEFVSTVTTLDASTSRLAKTTNLSVRELSAWQGAIQQNGGSAESAGSAISGLTGEVNRFMLTGQTSLLPVLNALGVSLFDQNKNLKTAATLYLDLADAIQGLDPARATALLSMIPGMNQDMINLLVQGRKAVEGYLAAAREAGGTTRESAAASLEYQKNLALLERTATDTGRSIMTVLAPALTALFLGLRRLFDKSTWTPSPGSLLDVIGKFAFGEKDMTLKEFWEGLKGTFSAEDPEAFDAKRRAAAAAAARVSEPAPKTVVPGSRATSVSEQEAYIRNSAIARGIDPDIAVAVAKSEGLNSYVGDRGTSFGPFQLHYKNNIPGLSNGGLGDVFTKQTGLDARDPSTWKAQVDFALDEAKKSGWGAWHGWKGLPNAGLGGVPLGAGGAAAVGGADQRSSIDSSSHSSVQVGEVTINAPNAKNANEIASEIPEALRRANWAASGNYAQV